MHPGTHPVLSHTHIEEWKIQCVEQQVWALIKKKMKIIHEPLNNKSIPCIFILTHVTQNQYNVLDQNPTYHDTQREWNEYYNGSNG